MDALAVRVLAGRVWTGPRTLR